MTAASHSRFSVIAIEIVSSIGFIFLKFLTDEKLFIN